MDYLHLILFFLILHKVVIVNKRKDGMPMMYIVVGVGGIIGAVLRFLITFEFMSFGNYFAVGILCINVFGCFLLGYLQGLASVREIPDWVVMGLGTGLIGAFTTFSTFSIEVIYFLENGEILLAICYIIASSFGGYLSVNTGFSIAKIKDKDV